MSQNLTATRRHAVVAATGAGLLLGVVAWLAIGMIPSVAGLAAVALLWTSPRRASGGP